MKRFLLGAAVLALTPAAYGQSAQALSYSQTDNNYRALCKLVMHQDDEGISSVYYCSDEQQDEVVAVGERVGNAEVGELTSPVTVISSLDIENRNQLYIGELLRSVPGISMNRSGPGGALTQIRIRGSEASHALVLVDGVEVANPTAGEYDLSGIRASDILKIEVLRGEQSALYGSDAVGGVINIITRSQEIREGWQASIEAGSFDTLQGQVTGIIPVGGASLSLGFGGLTTEGYDISGLGGEKDGSDSRAVNVGLNGLSIGDVRLSAKYSKSHLKTDFDEDLGFTGRLNNTDSETVVETDTARIDARFDFLGLEHLVTLSGHDIETDTRASFSSISKGERRQASWAAKYEYDEQSVTALAETEKETYDITPSFAFQPETPSNTVYALGGDYTYAGEALTISASARHDFNDRFKDVTTWKIGGAYAIENIGGRIRVNVGTGVKNPSLIELFGFYPEANFIGNPDLKPESSFGYGIGYEQTLAGDALNVSIDYFRADLEDEIFTSFASFPFLPRNRTTDSKREGVEIEARWKLNDQLSMHGAATFLDAEENGVEEIRRPDFLASMTVTWKPVDPLSLTLSIDHTGSQVDTDFAVFAPVTLDAFTLVGLNAAYDVNDIVTLTLRGENILDEDYQEVVGYVSQGRGIYAGLRARFN